MREATVAERLSAFALDATPPPVAAHEMLEASLFDWAACAIAGTAEPVAAILRAQAEEEGGRAEATVLGSQIRVPARAAALVNGTTSHALDYDDTHFAHIGHPSVAIIPAALAAAERAGADMAAFRLAALIGAEASVRFGAWLGRSHYETGFHQTATAGAIGATVAAGRLLGLTRHQMTHALGLVASRASGLKSQFGTMGKPLNAGIAAANGVEVATLAKRGFISTPAGLDGPQGFGPTHDGQGDASAWEGLGEAWLFEAVSHKFHACCHGLHAMLEAIAEITPLPAPADIAAVEVTAHPRWSSVCNIAVPETGLEAKFSFRLTAAMALSGVPTASMASYCARTASSPALAALRDRVDVAFDPALSETAASVTLSLAGGRNLISRHDLAGDIPMEVRRRKLWAKACALLGDNFAGRLRTMAEGDDLAAFCALLGRSTFGLKTG